MSGFEFNDIVICGKLDCIGYVVHDWNDGRITIVVDAEWPLQMTVDADDCSKVANEGFGCFVSRS